MRAIAKIVTENGLGPAVAMSLLLAGSTWAATTPAQKCQSAKNKEAGKYAGCRQSAHSKFATTGDGAALATALQKCLAKYVAKWPGLEVKAEKAGGACPSVGDQTAIQVFIDTHTQDVATALAGGGLPDAAPRGSLLKTEQTTCWAGADFHVTPCAGTGQDGDSQRGLARAYVDNGDGTITDVTTGLMWEKLSDDGSIHDKDNLFFTRMTDVQLPPQVGYDYADKLAALNDGEGFAGHADWRVPNVNELHSLVSYGGQSPAVSQAFDSGCAAQCTVLTCSCTAPIDHFSSSSTSEGREWRVSFDEGSVSRGIGLVVEPRAGIRAVRGGVTETTVTTTTSTTSTTLPGPVCCVLPIGTSCTIAASAAACAATNGTAGPGVCRNDGTCGSSTPPGDCCELPPGAGVPCLVSASTTATLCDGIPGGVFSSSATCTETGCE